MGQAPYYDLSVRGLQWRHSLESTAIAVSAKSETPSQGNCQGFPAPPPGPGHPIRHNYSPIFFEGPGIVLTILTVEEKFDNVN